MKVPLTRLWKFLLLFMVNLAIIAVLLYGFEYYLKLTDPFLKLPFDSHYYTAYSDLYSDLKMPADAYYTWGYPVSNNRFGFRERDFAAPKPAGVCRVMTLGDSLTWGVGLGAEERYTYLAETYLNNHFTGRQFEVLNFGVSGSPTTIERDILRDYKDIVNPDLVVVGFVFNDPQLKSQGYIVEKEQFYQKYGAWLDGGPRGLLKIGLPRLARTSRKALDNLVITVGLVPRWEVGTQRAYDQDSTEWREFKQALQDIRAMSDELGLPPPIFAVLNSGIYLDHSTSAEDMSDALPIYLRWYHQAEQTAAELGFVTYNYEQEFIEQLKPDEIRVNGLEGHPSAKVNWVYAQKLFKFIAAYVESGQLCPPGSPQTPQPSFDTPLAGQRLMRIRLNDQIRFLGYIAANPQVGRGATLHLKFGWQALTQIDANYTIKTYLLDHEGKRWAEQQVLPCSGDCPTVRWPPGMVAPPGSATIYWPLSAGISPLPLEKVFQLSHLKYSDRNAETVEIVPLPLAMILFSGSLVDEHHVDLTQLPPGEYTLIMFMLDPTNNTPLPAYDEVAQSWLPGGAVILGKTIVR